jgi:quercetin dioxygenase-like cupin family protein
MKVASRLGTLALVFISGFLLGTIGIPTLAAQRSGSAGSRAKMLLKADLAGCHGKEISIVLNEFGPGTSGKHYHPSDSFTYILSGSEVNEIDGKPSKVVTVGDVLHEEPKLVHTVSNTEPVRLLVVRVADKGQPDTVWIAPKP